MTGDNIAGSVKQVLRVALNAKGAQAYTAMAERLKKENPYVRVQPSAFVSFLVADYLSTYFEKDLGMLVAEFFDSQSFHHAEMQRAKASGDFETVIAETLETIKRMKSKVRRMTVQRKHRSQTGQEAE